MNTHHLEYIVVISEEKTLLRASEKLFISPSALSQAVSKLESELNTKLFYRSKDGWEPTVAGNIYIKMARDVITLQRRAYTEISIATDSFSSTLTIGTSPGGMATMLATIFPTFNARFPNIKINLLEARIFDIVKYVEERKVNLAFISASDIDGFTSQHTRTELLSSENMLLAVPKSYPSVATKPPSTRGDYPTVDLRQYRDAAFMLMSPGTTIRHLVDQLFAYAGFDPSIIFEASSIQTICAFAKTGYAATFLPELYAQPSSETNYYKLDSAPQWNRFVTYHAKESLSAPEKYLLTLAHSYYKNLNVPDILL